MLYNAKEGRKLLKLLAWSPQRQVYFLDEPLVKMHEDLFVRVKVRLKEYNKVFSTHCFISIHPQQCYDIQNL